MDLVRNLREELVSLTISKGLFSSELVFQLFCEAFATSVLSGDVIVT